jgi:mannose-6-phosphate isomerase-like protein (cupin superfamily)
MTPRNLPSSDGSASTVTSLESEVEKARRGRGYSEFLRVPSMSVGVYVLAAGATDTQIPHSEDEIYFVARGRGRFQDGEVDVEATAGDVLFVPSHRKHRFHSITEELVLLVVFAPAERLPD